MGLIRETFETNGGIFRLSPVFVPRRFSTTGHRLRLHPDDYFALGTQRGSIKERWFSSVIPAMNGPLTPEDEGMSYVSAELNNKKKRFLLKNAVEELGAELVGEELLEKHDGWPMYSKFFDYGEALFHHLHLDFDKALNVERLGKPEAYYFPYQLNNHLGNFPVTYFGFDPDVSLGDVKQRLLQYEKGDNRITELSRAYRIELGTGWYTPPGVVHAPGSVLTYEPQWNSDVNSVYENVTAGEEIYPHEFLVENCPENNKTDIEYVLSLMDWKKNIDPNYKKKYFRIPLDCGHEDDSFDEKWIVYGNEFIGAKELTIKPGKSILAKDEVAYGCVIIQGHGKFGNYNAESAIMLRYGQDSTDEYFVSEKAAKKGVEIVNNSQCEPMVILKHFGPNNPNMPAGV
jgi:hypothetical protein